MTNETTTQSAKGLFAGKARTVAAVAAFSGLALATTVSVQATQNASDEQAPAAAVSEAPASEKTVSAEPAAKADKAEKAEKAPAKKAEPAKAPAQPAVVQAAPVAEVTPVEAPAAPQVAPAAQTVAPVAEQAPAPAQGRHAAQPTQQTLQAEAAAEQGNAIYNYGAPQTGNTTQVGYTAQAGYTAQTGYDTTANTGKVTTQSSTAPKQAKAASSTPASGQGQAILSAAEGQIGVNQDCTALVSNALAAVGINHHGWPASYKSLGTPVSAAEAQAGDIAYYADGGAGVAHVAIYAGNGQAIHGGWNGNQTVKTTANVGSGPEYIRVG
ncbi:MULTISPECIES: C40 family peptidase [Kocuria]|uniref:C40 family peptidase n=1 Tax=Kocuria TaxID=57493 RepID=UPI0008A5FFB9|nr:MULTISPECIES: NlpC/P60 family protein [Kocuria]OFK08564.1 hypothetical protein HMPREF2833_00195 [Kocuria sp. HMSC066H03]PKZ37236.1 hypothetical protein CYJ75_11550 [Kocuria rhizophila]